LGIHYFLLLSSSSISNLLLKFLFFPFQYVCFVIVLSFYLFIFLSFYHFIILLFYHFIVLLLYCFIVLSVLSVLSFYCFLVYWFIGLSFVLPFIVYHFIVLFFILFKKNYLFYSFHMSFSSPPLYFIRSIIFITFCICINLCVSVLCQHKVCECEIRTYCNKRR
jgi:hypothetical protein